MFMGVATEPTPHQLLPATDLGALQVTQVGRGCVSVAREFIYILDTQDGFS